MAGCLAMTAAWVGGAEIRLRSEARAHGNLVRLQDVAEISASPEETAKLGNVELFPAPSAGDKRTVTLRQLQDVLALRGVNLFEQRFSGALQVNVLPPEEHRAKPVASGKLSPGAMKQAAHDIEEAIVKHLHDDASSDETWSATVELTEAQARVVSVPNAVIAVTGGLSPWVGTQQFNVSVTSASAEGKAVFAVRARVVLPPMLVVAVRSLPKGTLIRADDVQLQRRSAGAGPTGASRDELCQALSDAIGHETTRAIVPGQVLETQAVRRPLMVKRGEVVTVYARTAGIEIRTTARCRDDGSQGDLINVESLLDRSTFTCASVAFKKWKFMRTA